MNPEKDIQNIDDIKILVDSFYLKIREDDLLAPIFLKAISHEWQPHLDKMYLFWNVVLFNIPGYVGNPFLKHAAFPLSLKLTERWLQHFNHACDHHFAGQYTENAKCRAAIMAEVFLSKTVTNTANKTKSTQ